jgi:hypothetical protein
MMMWRVLFFLSGIALARRHPLNPCSRTAFILANEPFESQVFSQIPPCLQANAVRVPVRNAVDFSATKAQLDVRCASENCVVYSVFPLGAYDIPHAQKIFIRVTH